MANPSTDRPGPELAASLEAHRSYLRRIADAEMGTDLQAKFSASDVVQEAFLEAQRDQEQFHRGGNSGLRAWLRSILLNNLHNLQRYFRGTHRHQIARERSLDDTPQTPLELAADQTSPSGQVANAELQQALRAAVGRLPTLYRQVVELRIRKKLTFAEIGQTVGRSAEATRKVWVRALVLLNRDLGPLLGE